MNYLINKNLVVHAPKGVKMELSLNEKTNASFVSYFLEKVFGVKNAAIEFNNVLTQNLKGFYMVKVEGKAFIFDRVNQCITSADNVKYSLLY